MSITDPINVNIDIAGFFFSKTIVVERNSTLFTAMSALQSAGSVVTDNGTKASLSFTTLNGYLSKLGVKFADTPVPRQAGADYPSLTEGTYALEDGFIIDEPEKVAGVATLNWQFYVHAATFSNGKVNSKGGALNMITPTPTGPQRVITPLTGFPLNQDCLVTWRAIVIMYAPASLAVRTV